VVPLGVGIDLVDVRRVKRMLDRKGERALKRLLTDREQDYCLDQAAPWEHVAARIAAKEATYKALQIRNDARAIGWKEIEVVRADSGAPSIELHGLAEQIARESSVEQILVSLSHTLEQAAAIVVVTG